MPITTSKAEVPGGAGLIFTLCNTPPYTSQGVWHMPTILLITTTIEVIIADVPDTGPSPGLTSLLSFNWGAKAPPILQMGH